MAVLSNDVAQNCSTKEVSEDHAVEPPIHRILKDFVAEGLKSVHIQDVEKKSPIPSSSPQFSQKPRSTKSSKVKQFGHKESLGEKKSCY
jgi:hypothetical protein